MNLRLVLIIAGSSPTSGEPVTAPYSYCSHSPQPNTEPNLKLAPERRNYLWERTTRPKETTLTWTLVREEEGEEEEWTFVRSFCSEDVPGTVVANLKEASAPTS